MRDCVLPDYTHIKRVFIRPLEETTGKAKGSEQVCVIMYNTVMRVYVLPDYTHIKRGFIQPLEETTGKAKGSEQGCVILYNTVMRDYHKFPKYSDTQNFCCNHSKI